MRAQEKKILEQTCVQTTSGRQQKLWKNNLNVKITRTRKWGVKWAKQNISFGKEEEETF